MGGTGLSGLRARLLLASALVCAGAVSGCDASHSFAGLATPWESGTSGIGARGPAIEGTEAQPQLELAMRLARGAGVGKDPAAGAALVERLAQAGVPAAQEVLAGYYLSGLGVEKKPDVAVSWLRKAADRNYAPAQAELAVSYLRGLGVARDYARALRLAKAAARQGNTEGEDTLGVIYANGWGVATDGREAIKWLTKAVDKKFAWAMYHMGESYRDGKGVPADNTIAYAWFSLAASNTASAITRADALKSCDELALLLLPKDLAVARRLAAEWKPGGDLVSRRAGSGAGPTATAAGAGESPTNRVVNGALLADASSATASRRVAALPTRMKLLSYQYEVRPDGSFTKTVHSELQIRNEAAVKNYGEDARRFSQSMDRLEVLEAYTLKPDGRRLPVEASAIHTRSTPGSPNLRMFDDMREKVIIFPSLESDDTEVVTTKTTSKPVIPGYFGISIPFDRSFYAGDVRIRIVAPKSMPLDTETHDMRFSQHSEGDKIVYEWRYANPNPLAESNIALDPLDRSPRFSASNFTRYDQLAAAYAELAEPKRAVTPKIKALANEITAGIADPRMQAEAIYNWVSRHIRYVALEIGSGALVPHEADSVLANLYGDCKDHAVLFSALLRAKGIASELVLINLGTGYSLTGAPTLGTLNHVITWLPEFGLYADTTAGVAPFGILPFGEYGKPVVHATASGQALHRTPVLPADGASLTLKTTARLGVDGKIVGDSESIASGPFSIWMRQDATEIQSAGSERAADYSLRAKGYDGTGRYEFASPFELAPTYRVSGHFELNARPGLVAGNSFFLPSALLLGPSAGDFLMGLLSFREVQGIEPTPCYSGHQVDERTLELPDGRHLRELPKGTEIHNKYLRYKSTWSMVGSTVTVHREFSSTIDQPVCIGEVRATAARALSEIRKDYNTEIALSGN